MFGLVFNVVEHALFGACLASLSLLFFSIAALLRLLPRCLSLIRLGLRGFLILSFRVYALVLTRLTPFTYGLLGVDLLSPRWRAAACLLLSLALGLLFLALTDLPITGWVLGIAVLHGLCVGLVWDGINDPGGLRLGVKIQ